MFTSPFSGYLEYFINYAIKTDNSEIKKQYIIQNHQKTVRVFSDFFKTFSANTFVSFIDLENVLYT